MASLRRNNYECAKQQARPLFLQHDQMQMVRRFSLSFDDSFLFLTFVGTLYRINRASAVIEYRLSCGTWAEAGFEEAMTIYDILCNGTPETGIGKGWCLVNTLPGVGQNSGVGDNTKTDDAALVSRCPDAFRQACKALGGTEIALGDIGFEIPVFSFFPVRLRFYDGDEDFPPRLDLLFHDRTLQYMHYETTYYAAACLLKAVRGKMKELTDC